MAKLKRLPTREENLVDISFPLSTSEIEERNKEYHLLTPKQFGTKFKELLYTPIEFTLSDVTHQIQYNHCANPYCANYGRAQIKFATKGKPTRYKLSGVSNHKSINCNPDPTSANIDEVLGCSSATVSNWSVAQEIQRLIRINSVEKVEPEYTFHIVGCTTGHLDPFEEPNAFYKRGRSSGKSQKWQCKLCKKITNVLPDGRKSITYNQKRSDVLPLLMKLLLSRVPIVRSCEILEIGRGTYYDKLEFLYKRCLEFLERHETKPLQKQQFDEVWLNTDKMTYYLNNVRQKGMGGSRYVDIEESHFPTNVVITSDVLSRYVFRSDVAYDWEITFDDVALDTILQKEDHLNEFAKKYAQYPRYSHFPQPPSSNDTQTEAEYRKELEVVERRMNYTEGLHVNSTYTTLAHLWLIKQLIRAKEWRFVTDKDNSIITSINRVFANEIRMSNAHHFLCQTDKTKTRKQAREEFTQARDDLIHLGINSGYDTRSLRKLAYLKLEGMFHHHTFHKEVITSTGSHLEYADKPIEHPLATIDRGFRSVDCTTNLSSMEPKDIAALIMNVNDNATNTFIQHIRRRLSILERPLTTARGDGKSYIYSNSNPKYAQMALTILRTYYNFCFAFKSNSVMETPAQRIGIAKKKYNINDIIYMQ